jgi:hypothetical protein
MRRLNHHIFAHNSPRWSQLRLKSQIWNNDFNYCTTKKLTQKEETKTRLITCKVIDRMSRFFSNNWIPPWCSPCPIHLFCPASGLTGFVSFFLFPLSWRRELISYGVFWLWCASRICVIPAVFLHGDYCGFALIN